MTKTKEQVIAEKGAWADDITLYTIASVKSYNYMMEYDPNSGIEVERAGSNFLKQGYIDGFIAGFTHKLTGE
jgi:hypothetical protein